MQSRRQSHYEVGVDFMLSLCVNIGGQLIVYGALATVRRSLTFTALVLGLAIIRRYTIRRLFNTLHACDKGQSRSQSWCEVGTDTVIAFGVAIILQWFFYGAAATWAKAGGLTVIIYLVTMTRRYLLRRIFELWSVRQSLRTGASQPTGA